MFTEKERDSLVEDLEEMNDAVEKINFLLEELEKFFDDEQPNEKARKRARAFLSLLIDEVMHLAGYMPSTAWARDLLN